MFMMRFSRRLALGVALAAGLSLAPRGASAQLLAGADWFEREVAEGVVWRYYQFDDLFGGPQSISYVEADLDDPNVEIVLPYLPSSRQRTSLMIPAQFPAAVAGINATYFDTSAGGGGATTYLRIGSAEINPQSGGPGKKGMRHEGAFAFDADGTARIVRRPDDADWRSDTEHTDVMANGPLLQVEGEIPDFAPIGAHCSNRHPRSVVGLTPDHRIILLTVDGRTDFANGMTCDELALVMKELGCSDSLNLDGGGSTTLWVAGEPNGGVVNFPSDNGAYDHAGERSCSNAIAIVAPTAVAAPARDARLTDKRYGPTMTEGDTQSVTLLYENIGTDTWTPADTWVQVARPGTRTSAFAHGSWSSARIPATMTPASVATGETATFQFVIQAPEVSTASRFEESFALHDADGRFGPADNDARLVLTVENTLGSGVPADIIVEARSDGQNYVYFDQSGFADTNSTCSAFGCTATGTRYGSTYRSVAGAKSASFAPTIPLAGNYRVYAAWPAGGSRRSPITYHVTYRTEDNADARATYQIDQSATANEWVLLGEHYFAQGTGANVEITNEEIDVSGSMYAGAVKFEFSAATSFDAWNSF